MAAMIRKSVLLVAMMFVAGGVFTGCATQPASETSESDRVHSEKVEQVLNRVDRRSSRRPSMTDR